MLYTATWKLISFLGQIPRNSHQEWSDLRVGALAKKRNLDRVT
jgi:hypothetical protein